MEKRFGEFKARYAVMLAQSERGQQQQEEQVQQQQPTGIMAAIANIHGKRKQVGFKKIFLCTHHIKAFTALVGI